MAIGIGWDIHRLAAGRKLRLGGVEIPHPKGALGHSDGDVVLHALVDALLGAAGGGDIGQKFPDTDPVYRDAPSRRFVEEVWRELAHLWQVENVDLILFAEEPKIAPHREAIAESIAGMLNTYRSRINVKAKTMEGLGPIGAGEAIAAQAAVELVLLRKAGTRVKHRRGGAK